MSRTLRNGAHVPRDVRNERKEGKGSRAVRGPYIYCVPPELYGIGNVGSQLFPRRYEYQAQRSRAQHLSQRALNGERAQRMGDTSLRGRELPFM